jgi:hypothetical protein
VWAAVRLGNKNDISKFFLKKVAGRWQKVKDCRKMQKYSTNICKCEKFLLSL